MGNITSYVVISKLQIDKCGARRRGDNWEANEGEGAEKSVRLFRRLRTNEHQI